MCFVLFNVTMRFVYHDGRDFFDNVIMCIKCHCCLVNYVITFVNIVGFCFKFTMFGFYFIYVMCSKSIANFEFPRVTYIRFSIFLWSYVGTHIPHLCRQVRPF